MATAASTRPPLTRQRVVLAALGLIDREGLEVLSMRRLAADLGVEAMSLYHHVQDKSDVLDGVVGAVLDEIELPADGTWSARAAQVARELRRVVRAHPGVHSLVVERAFRSPSVTAPAAALLGALGDSGLAADDVVSAFWTVLSYTSGSLSCELAEVAPELRSAPGLPDALFDGDLDRQFERGLDDVLRAVGPR